jgi:OmpA-OmpF porin, OOP family
MNARPAARTRLVVPPALPRARTDQGRRATPWVRVLTLAALSVAAAPTRAQSGPAPAAGEPGVVSQRDIERALSAPRTRGLRIAPRADDAQPTAASAPTPAPVATEVEPAAGAVAAPDPMPAAPAVASVALDVPFEINSSALRPAAAAQLEQLASALRSEALAPFRFLVAGHTDASGDAAYNRRLSGRRADVVRRRLIDAGVDPRRLDARGFGEDELLDPAHPNAAANRRVEIRNLGVGAR